jgi:hypothetical protein
MGRRIAGASEGRFGLEAEEERGLDWIEVERRRFGGEVLWGFIFGARRSGGKEFGGGGKVRNLMRKLKR